MKKRIVVYLVGLLSLVPLCSGMNETKPISEVQQTTWDHKETWIQFQELSQLSEKQQQALIQLAKKSSMQETDDLLLASRAVAKSSSAIIERLKTAKSLRTAYGARLIRAVRLYSADVNLLAPITLLQPEEVLAKLSVLSSLDQQTLDAMVAQAPQAKTKDIEELICRFEKVYQELIKFITLIESMKAGRKEFHADSEKETSSTTDELEKEFHDVTSAPSQTSSTAASGPCSIV